MRYDVLTHKKTGEFVVARPEGHAWGSGDLADFDLTTVDVEVGDEVVQVRDTEVDVGLIDPDLLTPEVALQKEIDQLVAVKEQALGRPMDMSQLSVASSAGLEQIKRP